MTVTNKQLFDPVLLTTIAINLYQVPVNAQTVIKYLTIHNTSTEPVTVTVYLVPSGGVAGLANQVYERNISGKDTIRIDETYNATINAGGTIAAMASAGSVISMFGSGVEIVN